MILNIPYRIRRLFKGERGIVERVQSDHDFFSKDGLGGVQTEITFRNPLGQIKKALSPLIAFYPPNHPKHEGYIPHIIYKKYETGDQFP